MNKLFYSDEYTKDFFRDHHHFASLCNGVYYQGEEVIKPEDLSSYDSEKSTIIDEHIFQRRGDIIKKISHDQLFMLVYIENQQEVDDTMPLRMLEYATLDYHNQPKKEKLLPVFGMVLYYGDRKWNGPISLSEMVDIPSYMKKYFNDWPVQLIHMNEIDPSLFHDAEVKMLVEGIQKLYSVKKGKAIGEWKIPSTIASVLAHVTKTKNILQYVEEDKEGNVDMCESIDRLMKECKNEGIDEGRLLGIDEGRTIGINEGRSQGIEQTMVESIMNIMSSFHLTLEQAMEGLNVPTHQQEKYKNLVNEKLS